jgi:uncharacterized membrane protein YraQ (UPF0718 family)
MDGFWATYGEAVMTAAGFFWKAGWAFVLGYAVSAMIQAFVPKARLAPRLGKATPRSIGEATVFGAVSSSCSFAALAAARSLVLKGAHFVAAVAFMFASTNLVIELGILILIFLGWQFLAAEIVGGVLLIAISSVLIRLTYPRRWLEEARRKVEAEGGQEMEDFDWKKRLTTWTGWCRVGHRFVMEWKMVWREILIGFTVAGFVAVFVPDRFWKAVFLNDLAQADPANPLVVLENALVAPFVAALTFIGSMGNIPLATVLNSGGVLFAGIMGFIYSDLVVPPLVKVNAKYYGWRVALYIAGVMYVSIVATALVLHYGFLALGMTPESASEVEHVALFAIDYTFWMNLAAVAVVALMVYLYRLHLKHRREGRGGHHRTMPVKGPSLTGVQSIVAYAFLAVLAGGALSYILTR